MKERKENKGMQTETEEKRKYCSGFFMAKDNSIVITELERRKNQHPYIETRWSTNQTVFIVNVYVCIRSRT